MKDNGLIMSALEETPIRRLSNVSVFTAAFLTGMATTSADNNGIPILEEEARRYAWLFLDTIPGD